MNKDILQKIKSRLHKLIPILVWVMSLWFAYKLIDNGVQKLDPEGFWTSAFEKWGYPVWFRIFIGVLEVVGGVLLIIPRVRIFGGLILCMVMLGALSTRLVFGTGYEDALYLLFMAVSFLFFAGFSKE